MGMGKRGLGDTFYDRDSDQHSMINSNGYSRTKEIMRMLKNENVPENP